jgi:hypothetical protein
LHCRIPHQHNSIGDRSGESGGRKTTRAPTDSISLADEIRGTYRGMMIAIPAREGKIFGQMSWIELSNVLRDLAQMVNLTVFMRHPRAAPKKTRSRLKRTRPAK